MKLKIIRCMKDKDFTVINNEFLRDKELSLKAKGFLTYLLSLPNDWDFTIQGIISSTNEGEESIRTCLKQLTKKNYIQCEPVRINGRFAYNQYTIIEKPHVVKPDVENKEMDKKVIKAHKKNEPHAGKSDAVKPDVENQVQLNTINNKILNKQNNIDLVEEKILFSQSVYFERFSLFEKEMKKFFTKKNIDFNYYYKTICEGKKTQSEKFTNEEWKEFFINGINFLIEKYGLVKIEKEKIILHSFENSVYFENYELFKTDFEEKYPNIDSKYYHEKYSNQAIAKGYKNADWKRTFQNWLNDLKGNYQKIEVPKPEIKQTPLVRKMSLSDEKHERIHEILQGENPKEILEANYGINSVLYLSQMIDYIFPKNNYNVTEIWNRK